MVLSYIQGDNGGCQTKFKSRKTPFFVLLYFCRADDYAPGPKEVHHQAVEELVEEKSRLDGSNDITTDASDGENMTHST